MKKTVKGTALILSAGFISAITAGCGGSTETSDMYYETTAGNVPHYFQTQQMAEENYADEKEAEAVQGAWDMTDGYDDGYYTPPYSDEEYNSYEENGFKSAVSSPLSTFSADVDTASYSNVRRMILDNGYVEPDAVRIEEMINYFDYDYSEPENGEPFAVYTELSDCPWNPQAKLFMAGLSTKSFDALLTDREPANLVFLIDVSGSMYSEDKLPLVQSSFNILTENLQPYDRVSIVTYAGADKVVLEGADGAQQEEITEAINSLEAGGSTAGAAGLITAYEIAEKYFVANGNNRIILATDGDLNVGISDEEGLKALVEEKRDSGVFLSVLGFGTGNYKDDRLEAIADCGNGNYSYIDSMREARKVLADEMSGTLFTAAKDVKFQVEFNPENVSSYRLVGYENRVMAAEDFNDDTKDAGEIGAGHSVTVLYEIIPADSLSDDIMSGLKYSQTSSTGISDEILTLSIRYKEPDGDKSKLLEYPVKKSLYDSTMSEAMNLAACAAEFGMVLKNSEYIGDITCEDIYSQLCEYDYSDDDYKVEFLYLVKIAGR